MNPRPTAVFAMFYWGADYAAQRGGVMDFYDALHPADQQFCTDAVTAIINAGLVWGVLVREGEVASMKSQPRLKRTPKRSSRGPASKRSQSRANTR